MFYYTCMLRKVKTKMLQTTMIRSLNDNDVLINCHFLYYVLKASIVKTTLLYLVTVTFKLV